jgi:hypothetical protein
MSKPKKISSPKEKRAPKASTAQLTTAPSPQPTKNGSTNDWKKSGERRSKQSRVVEMLRSPTGATIAAVMKATGWQQHSVRGFFAGVVQKKLRLKLNSEKIDGKRIYRIVGASGARSSKRRPSRQTA